MYYVMNSPVMPNNGKYDQSSVTIEKVKFILKNNPFISAIGHQSTADLLSKLTDISIPVNRIAVSLKDGDIMIVFKLKTRLSEGTILNEEELAKLEYEFSYVTYKAPKCNCK